MSLCWRTGVAWAVAWARDRWSCRDEASRRGTDRLVQDWPVTRRKVPLSGACRSGLELLDEASRQEAMRIDGGRLGGERKVTQAWFGLRREGLSRRIGSVQVDHARNSSSQRTGLYRGRGMSHRLVPARKRAAVPPAEVQCPVLSARGQPEASPVR